MELQEKERATKHGDISYVEVGSGPAAFFVHGAFVTGALWRNVIDLVAEDRRCIAIDLPAHGHTRISAGVDLSPRGHAEIFDEFCAALDLGAVDLIGNDSGGAMCQLFAAHHPERVRTLTLTNCETPNALTQDTFTPSEFTVPAQAGDLAPRTAHLLHHPEVARAGKGIGIGYARSDELTDEVVRAYLSPTFSTPERGREFERWLVGLASQDLREAEPLLRRLDVPTLIVWGTGDDLFDLSAAHWLEATIPSARPVVEIEGGKLFFSDERHAELARALRRLWIEHPGEPRSSAWQRTAGRASAMDPDITLTPTTDEDGPVLRAQHATPEVAKWWDLPDPGFPMHDEPESTRFTVRYGDEIAGLVQYGEENEPKYRSASMDIFLGPAFHGRGIGSRAIRMVLDILIGERGHHRVTIDPAATNHTAIRCYEKAGFQRVGILQLAERDSDGHGWHDTLLMELVVDPTTREYAHHPST